MKPFQIHELNATVGRMNYALRRISKVTGNISFGLSNTDASKNIVGYWALNLVTPATANSQFSIAHSLGYVPIGFHVVNKNTSCDLYASGTAWTSSEVFLKCTVASATVNLFIF